MQHMKEGIFYIPVVKENNMKPVPFKLTQIITTHLFLKIHIMIFQRGLSMKLFQRTLFMRMLMTALPMLQKEVITFLKKLLNRKKIRLFCNSFHRYLLLALYFMRLIKFFCYNLLFKIIGISEGLPNNLLRAKI